MTNDRICMGRDPWLSGTAGWVDASARCHRPPIGAPDPWRPRNAPPVAWWRSSRSLGSSCSASLLSQLAAEGGSTAPSTSTSSAPSAPIPTLEPTPEPTVPAAPAAPQMTVSQENALAKAEEYLDYTAFSKSGLVKQLKYEGFSTADANFAVANIQVDWNEQAAKIARNYMDQSSFSRSSLINQLKYEGFTAAQAAYGAKSVGL